MITSPITYYSHTRTVIELAWSPNGNYIVSGGIDGTVRIWSVTGKGNTYIYHGHGSNSVFTVSWSHDGKYIASGAADTSVQVWQAPIS